MRVVFADGRLFDVLWPLEGMTCGVRGGSLTMRAEDDYRLIQTDYQHQMPFVSGATEDTRRKERNRGRVRLHRANAEAV